MEYSNPPGRTLFSGVFSLFQEEAPADASGYRSPPRDKYVRTEFA